MFRHILTLTLVLVLLSTGAWLASRPVLRTQAQDLGEHPQPDFFAAYKVAGMVENGQVVVTDFDAYAVDAEILKEDITVSWDGTQVLVKLTSELNLPGDAQVGAFLTGIREIEGTNAQIRELKAEVEHREPDFEPQPQWLPATVEVAGGVVPNWLGQDLIFSIQIELVGEPAPNWHPEPDF